MKNCMYCSKETKFKFCNQSCVGLYYKTHSFENYCVHCNKLISLGFKNRRKYCDDCKKYNPNFRDWSETDLTEHFSNLPIHQAHARIRAVARALFKKSRPNINSCEHCGYDKHFEICHIKAISSFDKETPISVINDINNLVALCPNCHWEFDHGILFSNS